MNPPGERRHAQHKGPPVSGERFGALELMQALQLGHAVAALHALGVMDALSIARRPEDLGRQFGLDAALLRGLLDHAARATDLVRRQGRRYRRTRAWNREARCLVGLYGLAFGTTAAQVQTLLRHPARGPTLVDRRQHALVFANHDGARAATTLGVLPGLLRQLGLQRVLDLGCGPATLLIELARTDPAFRGWGVEANAGMQVAARAALRQAGVARRVRLLRGDARAIDTVLPPAVAADVQAVVASQFVNEMFGAGTTAVVDWLRRLRRVLPGRLLVLADYCGRLGSPLPAAGRLTLVHDHAQLLSGQGVPPARRRDWAALYQAAGGRLVLAMEDTHSTRFVHVVTL
ncbi:MAG: SAM-dependent methyltransferase [Betaproteobacteria bacterium]